jgi:hypothetical protein
MSDEQEGTEVSDMMDASEEMAERFHTALSASKEVILGVASEMMFRVLKLQADAEADYAKEVDEVLVQAGDTVEDLNAKLRHCLDTGAMWTSNGTYIFPDGETMKREDSEQASSMWLDADQG